MPSLSKKSMPKLVHHKNKLEACSFNLCRKVFLKISPHFSSQTAITTNTNPKWLCTSHTQIWCSLLNCSWNWSTYLVFCTRVNIKKTKTVLIYIFWKMPKQICKNQNISDVNATCITFYLIANVFLQVSEDNIYIVDVLWGQSIKLIQVTSNSKLNENQ